MKMAGSEDPEAALAEERRQTRDRLATIRAARTPRRQINDALAIARGEMEPMRIYAFAEGEAAGPDVSFEQRALFRADQERDRRPAGPLRKFDDRQ
jgi:hypothetical protein